MTTQPHSPIAVLLLTVCVSGAMAAQEPTARAFARAVAEMRAGRFDNALPILERVVARAPGYLEARNNLAVCLIKTGRFAEAEEQLRYVLQAAPEKAGSRQNMGVVQHGLQRDEEAVRETDQAIRLFGEQAAARSARAAALFNRAWLFDEQGNLSQASEAYRLALELQPDYARAWLGLAVSLGKSGEYAKALEALQSAEHHGGADSTVEQLIAINRTALEEAQRLAVAAPAGRGFWRTGLIRWLRAYDAAPRVTVILYITAHVLLIGLVIAVVGGRYGFPLQGGELIVAFLAGGVAIGGLFAFAWGVEHWIVGIVVAVGSGSLTAWAAMAD